MMDNNVKREVLTSYSERFTAHICDMCFSGKDKLESKDIMDVQKIRQVNLFVVKNLYDNWQRETDRLRSPFFDYSSPEVQEAMQAFMNTLSHHIRLGKETYDPLLKRSTEETLLLIFSPYDFYFRLLNEYDEPDVPVRYLSYVMKYIKVNPFILRHLLDIAGEQNLEVVKQDQIQQLLDKALERTRESPEDVEQYLEQFSSYVPLSLGDIYGEEKRKETKDKTEPVSREEKSSDPKEEETAPEHDTHYKFVTPSKSTLNDILQKDDTPTLADIHQDSSIDDIRKSLSINQRFMFVNALFDGNNEAFDRTVEHLESVSNADEAISFLTHKYSAWDTESEEVTEFFRIVRRRHS